MDLHHADIAMEGKADYFTLVILSIECANYKRTKALEP